MTWQTILIFIVAVIVLGLVLKLFRVGIKTVLKIVVNAIIGGAALFLLNMIPGIDMTINWLTALLTGIFGVPAVIVIFIISLF